jgi:hypothetical protein
MLTNAMLFPLRACIHFATRDLAAKELQALVTMSRTVTMMTLRLSAQHNNDNGFWYVLFYFNYLTTKTIKQIGNCNHPS